MTLLKPVPSKWTETSLVRFILGSETATHTAAAEKIMFKSVGVSQWGSLKKETCCGVILVWQAKVISFTLFYVLFFWFSVMSFLLDKALAASLCHITLWHTSGRLYLDLNFSGSLPYDVRWDCFSSPCFSFCSVVWETPSNHQYNHHLFIQPSQSRKESCLFQLGFLDPGACRNNLSPPSPQCPICQLTDKAQMFLTCLFWCQQLCFICRQIPSRAKQSIRQSPNG